MTCFVVSASCKGRLDHGSEFSIQWADGSSGRQKIWNVFGALNNQKAPIIGKKFVFLSLSKIFISMGSFFLFHLYGWANSEESSKILVFSSPSNPLFCK